MNQLLAKSLGVLKNMGIFPASELDRALVAGLRK